MRFEEIYNDILYEYSIEFNDILPPNETLQILVDVFVDEYKIQLENWKIDPKYKITPSITNVALAGGYLDEYKLMVNDNEFTNRIYYEKVDSILLRTKSEELSIQLKDKEDEYMATFKFHDSKKRLNLTGDMGFSARTIMNYILNTIKDSLDRNDIVGFYYTINKKEEKRISFYDKIIEQIIKYKDKIVEIDENSIKVFYMF